MTCRLGIGIRSMPRSSDPILSARNTGVLAFLDSAAFLTTLDENCKDNAVRRLHDGSSAWWRTSRDRQPHGQSAMQIVDSPRNGNTAWAAVSALVAAGLLS